MNSPIPTQFMAEAEELFKNLSYLMQKHKKLDTEIKINMLIGLLIMLGEEESKGEKINPYEVLGKMVFRLYGGIDLIQDIANKRNKK